MKINVESPAKSKNKINVEKIDIHKTIFSCLFIVHNKRLSRHGQVYLMALRLERYFSHHRAT